ncbi:MAG: 6-phosphofructokinase [Planctomycetota bacterium]
MAARGSIQSIGILTSGGDCPGLNAAIRGIAKAAMNTHGMKVLGIRDGFRGLIENRTIPLDDRSVSGILTRGGTLLGTARDKPHKMPMGDKVMDMTEVAVANARKMGIDCLVCLGGGGTQKNAKRLMDAGLPVLTLPKTIDNDVAETEITFGFDTALNIATEAIDRLHTTATSHHRVIVCEVMGHRAGWLALGAGIAGGADVILIPEIPYDLHRIADYLNQRRATGKRFSIIAVAEGAHAHGEKPEPKRVRKDESKGKGKKSKPEADGKVATLKLQDELLRYHEVRESKASRLARQVQSLTGTEARVTSLGHVQRGGSPSPADRLLCTRLGTRAADLLAEGTINAMVAVIGDRCEPVPLELVAGRDKLVPLDHHMISSARLVDTCLGD